MIYSTKTSLPEQDVKIIGEALQGTLTDLVDLALVSKQIHWNVVGPRFRSIHLQLDEVVSATRQHSDAVAERASTLGIAPDGRSSTVASGTAIGPIKEGWQEDDEAVRTMVEALDAVISKSRERMAAVGRVDPVTEDTFIQLVGELEKHRWMFDAENKRS